MTQLAEALCEKCLRNQRPVSMVAKCIGPDMSLKCPVCGFLTKLNRDISRWMSVAAPIQRKIYGA